MFGLRDSARIPSGMTCKEAVDDAHPVDDEEAERQANDAAGDAQAAVQAAEAGSGSGKWNGDGGGDEHHSGDCAKTKNEQVGNSERRNANGGQNEKGDRGGTGEAVNDAYRERTQNLIKANAAESPIEPANRRGGFRVAMFLRRMRVGMVMDVVAVGMNVRV